MFEKIKNFIFRLFGKEERPIRFRDRESVFFDLTDEDGFSYVNLSDTIHYIPVRKKGGYIYAEPGMYGNIALLDTASMHPSSIVAEELFGPYTKRFEDILEVLYE